MTFLQTRVPYGKVGHIQVGIGVGLSRKQTIKYLAKVYKDGCVGDWLLFGTVSSLAKYRALMSVLALGGNGSAEGWLRLHGTYINGNNSELHKELTRIRL